MLLDPTSDGKTEFAVINTNVQGIPSHDRDKKLLTVGTVTFVV